MRHRKDAFDRLGAMVVLVGLGNVDDTAAFKKRFEIPFTMIADPEKRLFEAFRLRQASSGSLLSAGTVVKGLKALAKGHGIGVPQGDVRQLPGVFIIDSNGRIQFSHHASGPEDHPPAEVLLDVLHSDNEG